MRKIWKCELSKVDEQTISLPKESQILTVQIQHGKICIWVLVEPDLPLEERIFEIYGTGEVIKESFSLVTREYIGTFQCNGGDLVFHLFEQVR